MSTTVWVAPTRCDVEEREPLAVVGSVRRGVLEEQGLAEDRRGLRQRHRQAPLERRTRREHDVVERVAELVGEGGHGIVAAVEVHHHAAHVVAHARAVRAALLALA